ncbi:MAG: hypothetical protein K6G82_07595 [Ruminococcus sp.]|nr:hypothetical protein [Ruminococcus sp.]
MKHFLKEIEIALNSGLYTLAIVGALSLPDICATLEMENPDRRDGVGERYKEWYRNYAEKNCFLPAEACYLYRCSMVHKHNSKNNFSVNALTFLGSDSLPINKIAFFLPSNDGPKFINSTFKLNFDNPLTGERVEDSAILIEIDEFINGMIKSVNEWLEIIKEDENFKKNINDLIQPRPSSALNFIKGDVIIY